METDLASYVEKILAQLREEQQLIAQAIADLERLQQGRKRPRGRPPGRSNGTSRASRARFLTAGGAGNNADPNQ